MNKKQQKDKVLTILIRTNIVIIICLIVLTAVLLISKSFSRKPNSKSDDDNQNSNISSIINSENKGNSGLISENQTDKNNQQLSDSNEDGSSEQSDNQSINPDDNKAIDGNEIEDNLDNNSDNNDTIDETKLEDNDSVNSDSQGNNEQSIIDNIDNQDIIDNQEKSEDTGSNQSDLVDYSTKDIDVEGLSTKKEGWCFERKKDHSPSGTYEPFDISRFDGYYLDKSATDDDKVIYFTFDCGYEYGYTPKILDVLKKHNVKGMFFVTGDFLDTSADIAIRMKEEGHMVGNHTDSHPSLPTLSVEDIVKQITSCEKQFKEATGYEMDKFIRPPMGEYSEASLKVTQELGYKSIFWSIAYNDYDVNNQPGKDYVVDHFKNYHHNGAITLTHTVSKSNTEALDEVLTYLEEQGYRFGTLDELE